MPVWIGTMKGVSFEPYASNLRKVYDYAAGTRIKVILARDLANTFDPFAVCVYFNGLAVGYIPRSVNLPMLNLGLSNLTASLTCFTFFDERPVGACIQIEKRSSPRTQKPKMVPERHLRLVQKLTNTPRKIMV